MNGKKIQGILESLYPISFAAKWDNVGLQIGTMDKEVTGIVISLDLTIEVIEEAINSGSNLIICHHPAIFTPLKTIRSESYIGKMIESLIKNDITLYVMHTNFDHSEFGMNVILGRKLGLKNVEFFDVIDEESGLGVVGTITPKRADDFITDLKKEFGIDSVRYIGNLNNTIKKIAIIGGSGAEYVEMALTQEVDLFVTGDVSYHRALDSKNLGLNVLDIGHYFESHGIRELKDILLSKGIKLPILNSNINTNPYKIV